jgi:hypothetical protein
VWKALGDGDRSPETLSAAWHLAQPPLTKLVRRLVRAQGFHHVAADPDEIASLAADVFTTILLKRSAAWSSDGGALPWRYSRAEINSHLGRVLGPHTSCLDSEHTLGADRLPEPSRDLDSFDHRDELDVLASLAAHHAEAARLVTALPKASANRRHQLVYLAYETELAGGNPRPAVTVSALHGVSEANARQIHRRVAQALAA